MSEFWERQPYDTDTSYLAFTVYRDMGIARSLRKAAATFYSQREGRRMDTEGTPNPAALRRFKKWSRQNMWVARAEAFDAEEAAMRSKQMQQYRVEMLENHRRLARSVQGKMVTTLQSMDANATIPTSQWASILTAATTLERLTMGLSTENLDLASGRVQAEGQPDFSKLTDEELDQYIRLAEKLYGERD